MKIKFVCIHVAMCDQVHNMETIHGLCYLLTITKTCPCNIQLFFTAVKMIFFFFFDNFLIFAQNIDCGYKFEPPQ